MRENKIKYTTLKPRHLDIEYLADSRYDHDIHTNAKYIKDSIDYNDNPVASWFGKSSVTIKQIDMILRAYVQLVIDNYILEYTPNNYPAKYIEMVAGASSQTSNLTYRTLKIMYWGVKQNRIKTTAILYPKNKINDKTYRIPSDPSIITKMYNNITETAYGVVNKIGQLTTTTIDSAGKIVNAVGDTGEGLGKLGKYGVPVAVGGALMVIIYAGYNIAKTSDADKLIKVVDKVPRGK